MRWLMAAALTALVVTGPVRADDAGKKAPKVVLRSADGKKSYDLAKLTAAYDAEGLRTLAVFREKPEDVRDYVAKKDIKFLWVEDPNGKLWETFDTKAMPTNILIDKGGQVVKVVAGCKRAGTNA